MGDEPISGKAGAVMSTCPSCNNPFWYTSANPLCEDCTKSKPNPYDDLLKASSNDLLQYVRWFRNYPAGSPGDVKWEAAFAELKRRLNDKEDGSSHG